LVDPDQVDRELATAGLSDAARDISWSQAARESAGDPQVSEMTRMIQRIRVFSSKI
jgi:hypothetical protein